MTYVLTVDGARYECPTMEKLAEAIFDYGAESEEMTDAFWPKEMDEPSLSTATKDAMLKYVFHGSTIPMECLAHHVLRMYLRTIRPAVYRLDRGDVDVVEWESEFGPVTVTKEEDD